MTHRRCSTATTPRRSGTRRFAARGEPRAALPWRAATRWRAGTSTAPRRGAARGDARARRGVRRRGRRPARSWSIRCRALIDAGRVGAARARARPARRARSTASSPTSTASRRSSPRASCPRACSSGADHLEPRLRGRVAPAQRRLGDGRRASTSSAARDGEWAVLEDNLRTPSGLAYAARRARGGRAPPCPASRRDVPPAGAGALLGEALRAAAPGRSRDDPFVVLLTDGAGQLRLLGAPHARRAARAPARHARRPRAPAGPSWSRRPAAARRGASTSSTGAPTRTASPTSAARSPRVGEALLEPWRSGRIGLVNAFGTGVADDKLAHAYVEEMIRFYLGEEPVLPSVPTYDLGEPRRCATRRSTASTSSWSSRARATAARAWSSARTRSPSERAPRRARRSSREPEQLHRPGDRRALAPPDRRGRRALQPRHVDLRPFAYSGEGVRVLPGGLTRVALGRGRDGGQLLAERRRQGHMGDEVTERPLIGVSTSEVRIAERVTPTPEGEPPRPRDGAGHEVPAGDRGCGRRCPW